MIWFMSSVSQSIFAEDACLPAFCITVFITRNMATPANDTSAILQSQSRIMSMIMDVSRSPWVVSMTTLVATSPRFSMVFVVTDAISPILLELKYPIGTYLRCSAISIRLNAAVV